MTSSSCQECMKPEHDPKHYSFEFVSPYALGKEILALDKPEAWNTAGHVFWMRASGEICHGKGHLATGSSEFRFRPPIPGLRLDFGGEFVTFAEEYGKDKLAKLYERLAQVVCIQILHRAEMLSTSFSRGLEGHALTNGLPFQHKTVREVLERDDALCANWSVLASESKKRKLEEQDN